MTAATTILTMLAMLWHAMAGCCAHHVHEETSHPHEHVASCGHSHLVVSACGHQHADHQDDSSEQHEHHHDVCGSSDCVFSLPNVNGESLGLIKAIGCQPYFDTACLNAPTSTPDWFALSHPHLPDRCPLVQTRLYLQVQVLLI